MSDSRQLQDHSLACIYLLYLDSYYACGTSEQSQSAVSCFSCTCAWHLEYELKLSNCLDICTSSCSEIGVGKKLPYLQMMYIFQGALNVYEMVFGSHLTNKFTQMKCGPPPSLVTRNNGTTWE